MTDTSSSGATQTPKGVWVVAGTPVNKPYPCRCRERRYDKCSPVFCPCAGRPDPQEPACCAHRVGPAEVVQAGIEYRIRKMQQGG